MSDRFRSLLRRGPRTLGLALCLAFCTLPLLAQVPEPASDEPSASMPAPPTVALSQGQAESAVLDWVLANSGPLHGNTRAGAFRVAFTVTPAEGWWDKAADGKLQWHDAPANNVHLRIFVTSLADGRLVSGLTLHATLTDANGNRQSVPTDFGWYPLINAYGGNVPIPADSTYTLRVTIDPSDARSSHEHSTSIEFPPVNIAQEEVSHLALATAIAPATEADLLKPRNAALSPAITALWQHSISGAEKPSGDYFVGYALRNPSESFGARIKELLDFRGTRDIRIAVLVRDSRTGRLIPELDPQVKLVAANGKLYVPGTLSLGAQPWLTHYRGDTRIPRRGLYALHIQFDAPGFRRWGRANERFALPGEAEFDNLSLKKD